MGTNIAELQQLLAKKDVRIRELEVENMTLRSQLDKYHSVFNLGDGSSSPSAGTTTTPVKKGRKTARGVGISAEPQSLASLKDLTTKTFPSYKKSDKAQELIKSAIMDNDFMKNLESSQIKVLKRFQANILTRDAKGSFVFEGSLKEWNGDIATTFVINNTQIYLSYSSY